MPKSPFGNDEEWQSQLEGIVAQSLGDQANPMMGVAVAYREVFRFFVKVGFNANQALYLTSGFFNSNPGIAPTGNDGSADD